MVPRSAGRFVRLLGGLGLLYLVSAQAVAGPKLADRCFIVSIDGCAGRYLSERAVPNLRNLMQFGSWTWEAETTVPSLTLPATASMVSGLRPRAHGIDWDRWEPSRGRLRSSSLFTVTAEAGGRPAAFLAQQKLLHLIPASLSDSTFVLGTDDAAVMERVLRDLFSEQRALWFVELGATEQAARTYGWDSPEYREALEAADYQIGRLLDGIADQGLSASSALIVTADHGGSGTRSDTPGEESTEIPWIVCGPSIRANYQIAGRLRVYDTAATAVTILGLPVPDEWDGKPPIRVLGEN